MGCRISSIQKTNGNKSIMDKNTPESSPPPPTIAENRHPKSEWDFPSVVRQHIFPLTHAHSAKSPHRDSFIHDMLRPQLDSSVPTIGVRKGRRDTDELVETASIEMCLARVISLRDGIIQASQQPQNSRPEQQQQSSPQPSISSANSDFTPFGDNGENPACQWICGTQVTFEWLFQRLVEKFKCHNEPEPQWIVEKLNEIGDKDLDRTIVLRITFGWENPRLPKSVVLKISETNEDDPPEVTNLGTALFRRECQCYEWLSKQHQRRIAIPRIFVIKKQWSKLCNALLVMEDLSDRAQTGEFHEGITAIMQEEIRDLLRNLAQLHAYSMIEAEGWRQALGNAEQPTFLYNQIEQFARMVLKNGSGKLDVDKLKLLEPVMESANLERVMKQSCVEMDLPECLLHGLPFSRNVFFKFDQNKKEGNASSTDEGRAKGRESTVVALIDWTQAHCGCIGEDLAKCICWNLDKKEREEAALLRLLQYYHYQLLKKLQFYGANSALQKRITLDRIMDAYERKRAWIDSFSAPLEILFSILSNSTILPRRLGRKNVQLGIDRAPTAPWGLLHFPIQFINSSNPSPTIPTTSVHPLFPVNEQNDVFLRFLGHLAHHSYFSSAIGPTKHWPCGDIESLIDPFINKIKIWMNPTISIIIFTNLFLINHQNNTFGIIIHHHNLSSQFLLKFGKENLTKMFVCFTFVYLSASSIYFPSFSIQSQRPIYPTIHTAASRIGHGWSTIYSFHSIPSMSNSFEFIRPNSQQNFGKYVNGSVPQN